MSQTLGARLRQLRQDRQLRLADVSAATGLSLSWINDMEHDRNSPSLETLRRLATAFDTTVVEILRGTDGNDA